MYIGLPLFLSNVYNYQKVAANFQSHDYFKIFAPASSWSSQMFIGVASSFDSHNDAKWEIPLGGWNGLKSAIRDGNGQRVPEVVVEHSK